MSSLEEAAVMGPSGAEGPPPASHAAKAGGCGNGGQPAAEASAAALTALLRRQLRAVQSSTSQEELGQLEAAVAAARAAAPPPEVPERAQRCGSLVFGPPMPPGLAPRAPGRTTAAEAARAQWGERTEESDPAAVGGTPAAVGGTGRYEPWLCGARLRAFDVGSPNEWSEALAAIAKREPVLIKPLEEDKVSHRALLLPSAGKWDSAYLREHMGEWGGCPVLQALDDRNKYLYYFDKQPGRDMSACTDVPREASTDSSMSLADFLDGAPLRRTCAYLQAPLFERQPACGPNLPENVSLCPGMDQQMLADWRELDEKRLAELQREGRLGQWSRSQLFVGPSETLSPCHYDQYDNLFMQLRGAKHILLMDPWAAEGLYPFPIHHPYDEYARLDLENVDEAAFPRARAALAGRGSVATVGEGEVLFIPSHWWHHVCSEVTSDSSDPSGMSISLNFWFDSMSALRAPSLPLPYHFELELARHVEFLACDIAGPTAARDLAVALIADVGEAPGHDNGVPTEPRDLVLLRLLDLLGPTQTVAFVRSFLAAERFGQRRPPRAEEQCEP